MEREVLGLSALASSRRKTLVLRDSIWLMIFEYSLPFCLESFILLINEIRFSQTCPQQLIHQIQMQVKSALTYRFTSMAISLDCQSHSLVLDIGMAAPNNVLEEMAAFFKKINQEVQQVAKETVRFFKSEEEMKKEVQPHRFPELPKCKWQTMYEKRMKKQKEQEEMRQFFKAEAQKCKRTRIENMRFLPNEHLQKQVSKSINEFLSKYTQQYFSFLLPQIISIKSSKYNHSFYLEVIYLAIREQLYRRQKGKSQIQNHFSLFKNEIDLFGSSNFFFQFANNHKLDEFRRSLEGKLLEVKGQIGTKEETQKGKMKNIELIRLQKEQQKLHYLQMARIYRYDLTPRIEQYLFQDSETINFFKQVYPIVNAMNFQLAQGKEFELSDIGLFTGKSIIPQKEWEETYCYWYERLQLHYAFQRSRQDQDISEMQQNIREIVKNCVEKEAGKDYKALQMGQLITWFYSFLDNLQNQLMLEEKQFREKFHSALSNLFEIRERVLQKYTSCPQTSKSYLSLQLPSSFSIKYKSYNHLRIFCKWRRLQGDHQLQVTNMVSKLFNESMLENIAIELQTDYINQIIPIRVFLLRQIHLYKEKYLSLQPQIDEQIIQAKKSKQLKQSKKTEVQKGYVTPERRPTRIQVDAPRKQRRQELSSQMSSSQRKSEEREDSLDLTDIAFDFAMEEQSPISPIQGQITEENENDSQESEESDQLDLDEESSESPEVVAKKNPAPPVFNINYLRKKLQNLSNAAKKKEKVIEID